MPRLRPLLRPAARVLAAAGALLAGGLGARWLLDLNAALDELSAAPAGVRDALVDTRPVRELLALRPGIHATLGAAAAAVGAVFYLRAPPRPGVAAALLLAPSTLALALAGPEPLPVAQAVSLLLLAGLLAMASALPRRRAPAE